MLYYRTHASRPEDRPAELIGWESTSTSANLVSQIVGEHRVVGIVPQFVFAPPAEGWRPIGGGWEVASVGAFDPLHYVNKSSSFFVLDVEMGDKHWLLPRILTDEGVRAFRVRYGGEGFEPQMTPAQSRALALANEVRACHLAGTMPDYPVRARWAAEALSLTHALSVATIAVVGLDEEVIDAALAVLGGYYSAASR
jgi:hypothetical protein